MRFLNIGIVSLLTGFAVAQGDISPAPVPPTVTLLYRMEVQLGQRFSLGPVPSGQERLVIPIIGGTFTGPKLSGKILNGGADWRLTDANGKFRPDARYVIQANDGTYVYVQTEGPTLPDGRSLLRAKFETATNGTHGYLNDVVAVGLLNRSGNKVFIDMWQVGHGDAVLPAA